MAFYPKIKAFRMLSGGLSGKALTEKELASICCLDYLVFSFPYTGKDWSTPAV